MSLNPSPMGARSARGHLLYSLLLGSGLFLLQFWYWQTHIRSFYYPSGDDFALLVHSTRIFHAHPTEWFLRGFAGYFRPYPDIAVPYSEFLRPLDNSVYYLNSVLFGRSWSGYLLANYLIAAAVTSVAFVFAWSLLRLPVALAALVTLATIASPAYTYHLLYRPSFAFDYLGALWVLLCALCLVRGRLAIAWLFCLLAVLSKETAYYSAVAACVSLLACSPCRITRRRWLQSGAFLVPLLFVFLLRRWDFKAVTGVYVLTGFSPKELLRNVVLGFTQWPYMLPGEQHIFERSLHNGASLLLSTLLWILLGAIVVSLCRQRRGLRRGDAFELYSIRATLLVFLAGSLCLPMALGLVQRFGASTYPLLFLNLAALGVSCASRPWARWAAVTVLALITAGNGAALAGTFSGQTLQSQGLQWRLSRSLVQQLSEDRHAVQFLLGDRSESFASPATVQTFAGSNGQIIPISSVGPGHCLAPPAPSLTTQPGGYVSDGTLRPDCGSYILFATGRRAGDPGKLLTRDLPQARLAYVSPNGSETPGTYEWQRLHIEIFPKVSSYVILAPDPASSTYRVLAHSAN